MNDYYWKTHCEERTVEGHLLLTQGFFSRASAECLAVRIVRLIDHIDPGGEIVPESRVEGLSAR